MFCLLKRYLWSPTMTEGHPGVFDLSCCQRPGCILWSLFPLGTTVTSMTHAAAGCYGQASFFSSGVDDCRLITENERR